jgi:serine/threonine protein kinase/Tol biopolymer transport system component
MALSIGEKLGPYEVLYRIGAGGIGEVYKARDTRLERTVAIKVLPEHIAKREDLRARFEREARAVASLNHPHICTLHDIGTKDGAGYMVMEYLEGETLAARIEKGALPLDQALKFAIQIADALDRAHRGGITHRDVKPQNIMLTRDGVKVLDFGLAKSTSKPGPAEGTPTTALTQEGTVLGTPQYMAPEQFEGKEADARSDIWAFGAVLYEMLTGRRPFQGKSYASLLNAVLSADPAPIAMKTFTPSWLERLVRRCLAKDSEDRYYSMRDVVLDLRTPLEETTAPLTKKANRWPLALAAVMTVSALGVSIVHFREIKEQPRLVKMSVLPPENAEYDDQYSLPIVSPDGRRLAFVATTEGKEQLWVRDLDSLAARALRGTGGASYPFWSPDSRTIAFFAEGKLKKIDAAGGPALILCDVFQARGGTWSKKDVIVWGGFGTGTFRVPAAGGSATVVTAPEKASGAGDHRFPWFLPDDRHFLYTDTASNGAESGVYVADLESKDRKRVVAADSNAVYSPPGYLLFVREGTLMAQPFDAGRIQTTSDAVPIADQVDSQSSRAQYQFSISQNGVLAYTSGRDGGGALLTWFDRSGKVTGMLGAPNAFSWGAISPDGKTVAVQRVDQGLRDIWLHDLARGTASRLTFGPASNGYPVWSPDGRYVAFFSQRDGIGRPFQRAASGTGHDEVLSKPVGEPPTPTVVEDWSRDGRYLTLRTVDPKTKSDIWVLPLNPDKPGDWKPFPYLQTEFDERFGRLSPDGRWLAYTSDESKRNEVYVRSFPTSGAKWPVSTNGGERSVWSRDGKELYFLSPDGAMMAAEVKSGSKFETGVPKSLFKVRFARGIDSWFDVSTDGRFLIPVQVEQTAKVPITVVVNWQAGLKK